MNRPPNKCSTNGVNNTVLLMRDFRGQIHNLGLTFESVISQVQSEIDYLTHKIEEYDFESELDSIDHSNATADTTAKYLLTIAETGICAGRLAATKLTNRRRLS